MPYAYMYKPEPFKWAVRLRAYCGAHLMEVLMVCGLLMVILGLALKYNQDLPTTEPASQPQCAQAQEIKD